MEELLFKIAIAAILAGIVVGIIELIDRFNNWKNDET